ncbi:MAG: C45 family autoproteolytic acyltransferase/hydrolase [Armatimonadota bacterium]|jgi:isopenicillin-N N-acyltransferase-like protein
MRRDVRFNVVEMSGSRFEMGRQYGRQCRELIRDLAANFDRMLLPEEYLYEGREIAMGALPHVRREAPELVEEVEGIAEGADLPFEDVFRLSCSQEMNAWQGCMKQRVVTTVADECTTIAAQRDGSSLVAWNMDWWVQWQPYMVLLHGRPDNGPDFLAFAMAGSVGRPGLSETISVSANYLPYRAAPEYAAGGPDWAGAGIPYSFMARMLLAQKTTADALRLLERTKRMVCLNYTIGDLGGDACCVETMPEHIAVLRPEDGYITHSNSYHAPEFGGIPMEERAERDPRCHRAWEVLSRRPKPLARADIYAALRAHFPREETGVCVHRGGEKPMITLLSFVGDVKNREMWAAMGSPCEHRFLRYDL